MFHNFFVNTRSSLEQINKHLKLLKITISTITQLLFIGFYVYLICINVNKIPFLVTYSALLALSVFTLVITLVLFFNRGETRLEKRMNLERKRKIQRVVLAINISLKLAAIVLSGIELVKYPASEMQTITFILSIVIFFTYVVFNTIIYIITKEIDVIRLSVQSDIAESKILSKLFKEDKEYTEQENKVIVSIKERAKGLISKRNKK